MAKTKSTKNSGKSKDKPQEKPDLYRSVSDRYGKVYVIPASIDEPDVDLICGESPDKLCYGGDTSLPVYGPYFDTQHARSAVERMLAYAEQE